MVAQLHAKYKKTKSQSREKCCDKKWTYPQTDRPKFKELSQRVGPKININIVSNRTVPLQYGTL